MSDKRSPPELFYEFFAGGGMARAGLGSSWRCLFANDFDHKKARIYRTNWGHSELKDCDVGDLKPDDLPRGANLVWASFPCQDLSLAGGGAGLKGDRSGTFWPFWRLMQALIAKSRAPRLIVLENVCGTLTSHGGKDFATICDALEQEDYRFGAVVIDAAHFLPHSRKRLFVIALRADANLPGHITDVEPDRHSHPATLRRAFDQLSPKLKRAWIWWRIPLPPKHNISFADLIEERPTDVPWHSREETRQLLDMMSDINRAKVKEDQRQERRHPAKSSKRISARCTRSPFSSLRVRL